LFQRWDEICQTRSLDGAKSARGLAHSKTWRTFLRFYIRNSVVDCASPLALSPTGKLFKR
jgi:hypothetical protein